MYNSNIFIPLKGLTPNIKSSQTQTPNIQTSLALVNRLKFILSGAIHFIGSRPLEAEMNVH